MRNLALRLGLILAGLGFGVLGFFVGEWTHQKWLAILITLPLQGLTFLGVFGSMEEMFPKLGRRR